MGDFSVRPNVDAWVEENRPASSDQQSSPKLWVSGVTGQQRFAYLFFGRPYPIGATVYTATLKLTLAETWSGQTIHIRRVTTAWADDRINWNNRPTTVGTNEVTQAITGSAGDVVTINIEGIMADVAAGGNWHGLRIDIGNTVKKAFYSHDRNVLSQRPFVEIDWGMKPQAPSKLSPSSGRFVSNAKPVFTWEFVNKGQVKQKQTFSQLQISTSTSFAAPAYDSGKVANTDWQWSMAPTAYSLANDDVRYWRVKAWDAQNGESGWSDVQQFGRKTKGVATITSPGATVPETTPPIQWSLTVRTQESWRFYLFDLSVPNSFPIYDSGRRVSTDTSFTVPAGLVKAGRSYKALIYVWDTIDRAVTPGDPSYVFDTQDFTYARAGTPAPVTALTVAALGPGVRLNWTRATLPDYFALVVDGEIILDRIDPDAVDLTATTYQMDYYGASLGVAHTFEVEAVQLDLGVAKHSSGNATASFTSNATGIYLVDEATDSYVRITGPGESIDMSVREVGTTFDIVGSRRPVRVTDALMGHAGTIAGSVRTETEALLFLDLKGRLKELRLIAGSLNIPVELEEVSATPLREPFGWYAVSAALFQTREFDFDVEGA